MVILRYRISPLPSAFSRRSGGIIWGQNWPNSARRMKAAVPRRRDASEHKNAPEFRPTAPLSVVNWTSMLSFKNCDNLQFVNL